MKANTVSLPSTKYPIGTKFRTMGKAPNECEVIDYRFTFDSRGECLRTMYVAKHQFCGQWIVSEYPVVSIDRGQINPTTLKLSGNLNWENRNEPISD